MTTAGLAAAVFGRHRLPVRINIALLTCRSGWGEYLSIPHNGRTVVLLGVVLGILCVIVNGSGVCRLV